MKNYLTEIFLGIALIAILGFGIYLQQSSDIAPAEKAVVIETPKAPEYKYGFDKAEHFFEEYRIKNGDFLGDILMSYDVDFDRIVALEKKAEPVFSLRKLMAGKNLTFVRDEECDSPNRFIYQPNLFSYVLYDFKDDIEVTKVDIPFETCVETASIVVLKDKYVSDAMFELGLGPSVTDKLEDALAQISFFTMQVNDQLKFVFEQKYIDNKPVGVGKILSAAYKSGSTEEFSFYYENEKYQGYYDYDGRPTQKSFRRAPVRASRISSRFNRNRFHPVLKRRRPHLGTDYAAPTGTPILAVANGVVTKRSYTKGNGNYVKIRHDKTYDSQYLHMSRFAKGVKPGTRVKRDQVIGYVGSTGLATGPHVCFRFWKNGRQINHLRENFPPLDPLPEASLSAYYDARDDHFEFLDLVEYKSDQVAYASFFGS